MKQLIQNIQEGAGRAQFASFVYRSKGTGELARHTLILGANYNNLIEKSKLALELLSVSELVEKGIDSTIAEQARNEVLASFAKTLAAHTNGEQNEDYTKRGQYVPLGNGLNLNLNDNSIQLFGLSRTKIVIEPGEEKVVKSRPLTIAKNKIKKLLPVAAFREFALDIGNIQTVKMNGETLEIE